MKSSSRGELQRFAQQHRQAGENAIPSAPMITTEHVGRVAVFYPSASDVLRGVVKSHIKPLVGEIVKVEQTLPTKRGNIPNAIVTVRGRSGAEAKVNLVEQHLSWHSTWQEAFSEASKREGKV